MYEYYLKRHYAQAEYITLTIILLENTFIQNDLNTIHQRPNNINARCIKLDNYYEAS